MLSIPAVHIFANVAAYDEFSSSLNFAPVPIADVGAAAGAHLSLMRTGPLPDDAVAVGSPYTQRGEADVGVTHPATGASLAGGFVTGPGNAKLTHVAATAMCDMAFAMLRFPAEVKAMTDVPALLTHGAEYLKAAYNADDGSLVSVVYDGALSETQGAWRRVEQVPAAERQVSIVNGTGTEIYALSAPPPLRARVAGGLRLLASTLAARPAYVDIAPHAHERCKRVSLRAMLTCLARVQRRRRSRRRRSCCASSTTARRPSSRR